MFHPEKAAGDPHLAAEKAKGLVDAFSSRGNCPPRRGGTSCGASGRPRARPVLMLVYATAAQLFPGGFYLQGSLALFRGRRGTTSAAQGKTARKNSPSLLGRSTTTKGDLEGGKKNVVGSSRGTKMLMSRPVDDDDEAELEKDGDHRDEEIDPSHLLAAASVEQTPTRKGKFLQLFRGTRENKGMNQPSKRDQKTTFLQSRASSTHEQKQRKKVLRSGSTSTRTSKAGKTAQQLDSTASSRRRRSARRRRRSAGSRDFGTHEEDYGDSDHPEIKYEYSCKYHATKYRDAATDARYNTMMAVYTTLNYIDTSNMGLLDPRVETVENWVADPLDRVFILLLPEHQQGGAEIRKYTKRLCENWADYFDEKELGDGDGEPKIELGKDSDTHIVVPLFRSYKDKKNGEFFWGDESETDYGHDDNLFGVNHGYRSTNPVPGDDIQVTSFEMLDTLVTRLIPRVKKQIVVVGRAGQRWALMSRIPLDTLQGDTGHVNRIDVLFGQENSYGYLDNLRTTAHWKGGNCRGPNKASGNCGEPTDNEWTTELQETVPNVLWTALADKAGEAEFLLQGKEEDYLLQPPDGLLPSQSQANVAAYLKNEVFSRFRIHMTVDVNDRCLSLEDHPVAAFRKVYTDSNTLGVFHKHYLFEDDFCDDSEDFVHDRNDATRLAFSQGFHRFQRAKSFQFWMKKHLDTTNMQNVEDDHFVIHDCDAEFGKGSASKCRHTESFIKRAARRIAQGEYGPVKLDEYSPDSEADEAGAQEELKALEGLREDADNSLDVAVDAKDAAEDANTIAQTQKENAESHRGEAQKAGASAAEAAVSATRAETAADAAGEAMRAAETARQEAVEAAAAVETAAKTAADRGVMLEIYSASALYNELLQTVEDVRTIAQTAATVKADAEKAANDAEAAHAAATAAAQAARAAANSKDGGSADGAGSEVLEELGNLETQAKQALADARAAKGAADAADTTAQAKRAEAEDASAEAQKLELSVSQAAAFVSQAEAAVDEARVAKTAAVNATKDAEAAAEVAAQNAEDAEALASQHSGTEIEAAGVRVRVLANSVHTVFAETTSAKNATVAAYLAASAAARAAADHVGDGLMQAPLQIAREQLAAAEAALELAQGSLADAEGARERAQSHQAEAEKAETSAAAAAWATKAEEAAGAARTAKESASLAAAEAQNAADYAGEKADHAETHAGGSDQEEQAGTVRTLAGQAQTAASSAAQAASEAADAHTAATGAANAARAAADSKAEEEG
ncbi:unnamed protein product [Amoebophrya sp. A120]|nr:unnamed protein product [Amoebophrya sp. A120]|eukprot:GSA120T00018114001.1